jgi:hypothetical protein
MIMGVTLLGLALSGCARQGLPPVEIDSGPGAEVTIDGLHRITNSVFRDAWMKPDADFGVYTKVMLDPVGISYRRKPTHSHYSRGQSNFALTERQSADFKRYFREAFTKEIDRIDSFELVEAAGPDVLRIEPAIIDLVVKVPTHTRPAMDRVFTTSTADMTLLMELRDSPSGEILARVEERREARNPGRGSGGGSVADLYDSNAVTDTDAIRRVFRRWAEILAGRLEQMHAASPTQ